MEVELTILASEVWHNDLIFYILQNDYHYESSYCLSVYQVIIPYAVHYISVTYFVTGGLYIFIPFT